MEHGCNSLSVDGPIFAIRKSAYRYLVLYRPESPIPRGLEVFSVKWNESRGLDSIMKTSVCLFADENLAKQLVSDLRAKHLGAKLELKVTHLDSGDEIKMSIISAERPEHPLVLDFIADAAPTHASLLRCPHCSSARLDVPLEGDFKSPARLYNLLLKQLMIRLGMEPTGNPDRIVCRDCSALVTIDEQLDRQRTHANSFSESIAA